MNERDSSTDLTADSDVSTAVLTKSSLAAHPKAQAKTLSRVKAECLIP
jgi:hypothetical protein